MNKLSFAILSGFLFCFGQLTAQGDLINNGANIVINTGHDVRVEGDVQNSNNGSITNNGTIHLDANWTQTGTTTDYSGTGWLTFEGSGLQNITTANTLTIPQLRVDNNNRLRLNSAIDVSLQVDLRNNGNIELGTNNLTLDNGATLIGADVSHYVITNSTGRLRQTVGAGATFFPVGNSSYNPASITNSGTTDVFGVRVTDQILQDGTTGASFTEEVVDRTWLINEEVAGGSVANITLEWETSQELPNFDRLDVGLMHYTSGTWDKTFTYGAATTVSTGRYQVTGVGVSNFSPFGVTTKPTDLPVELLAFDANRQNADKVLLNWTTAAELNNKGFEVERMLNYETEFVQVGFVDGNGTTTNTSHYDFLDNNSYVGVSYYRLKQVDFDGSFEYSPIRAVDNKVVQAGIEVATFPNPTANVLYVRFAAIPAHIKNSQIKITDVRGRALHEFSQAVQSHQRIEINFVEQLMAGTYFVTISFDDGQEITRKFIKKEV